MGGGAVRVVISKGMAPGRGVGGGSRNGVRGGNGNGYDNGELGVLIGGEYFSGQANYS